MVDRTKDEEIILFPVVGWETATIPQQSLLVRLMYVTSPLQDIAEPNQIGLCMTAAQARELAETLLKKAAFAELRTDRPPAQA